MAWQTAVAHIMLYTIHPKYVRSPERQPRGMEARGPL